VKGILAVLVGGAVAVLLAGPLAVAVLLMAVGTPTMEAGAAAATACTSIAPPLASSVSPVVTDRASAWQKASSAKGNDGSSTALPLPLAGQPRRYSLRTPAAPIPGRIQALYVAAGARYSLPWQLLAGIGMIETRHGAATATSSAGALGLMQFMPATFAAYGVDGDGDGRVDILDPADSIHTAARYLVASGARNGPDGIRAALFAYNHADWYVNDVLTYAHTYAAGAVMVAWGDACPSKTTSVFVSAGGGSTAYRFILPVGAARSSLTRPHHDYPALDIAVPIGTPYYAITAGIVTRARPTSSCGRGIILAGNDGATYTYCHGSTWAVATGQRVVAGQILGRTGNTGHSTGPHLHLQIRADDGTIRCPQRLVLSLVTGRAVPAVNQLDGTGCAE
jgi:murein DD-endopeptidase MepM/ murein hydrolase activator NlpD